MEKLKQSNPNPPAHNAYATTPQPANPVRHAAIYDARIPCTDACVLITRTRYAVTLAVNAARSISAPEDHKTGWRKISLKKETLCPFFAMERLLK